MNDMDTYDQKALGKRIRIIRNSNEMTVNLLAEKAGVSSSYINKLERGEGKSVSLNNLLNIATALDVTVDDLIMDSLNIYKNLSTIESNNHTIQRIIEELSSFSDDELSLYYRISNIYVTKNKKNREF